MKCEFAHMAENNPNFACIIKVSESLPSLSTSKQSKQQKANSQPSKAGFPPQTQ